MSQHTVVGSCNMGDETHLELLLQTLHRSGCSTFLHELLMSLVTAWLFCLTQTNPRAMFKERSLLFSVVQIRVQSTLCQGCLPQSASFPASHSKLAEKQTHTSELGSTPKLLQCRHKLTSFTTWPLCLDWHLSTSFNQSASCVKCF